MSPVETALLISTMFGCVSLHLRRRDTLALSFALAWAGVAIYRLFRP